MHQKRFIIDVVLGKRVDGGYCVVVELADNDRNTIAEKTFIGKTAEKTI